MHIEHVRGLLCLCGLVGAWEAGVTYSSLLFIYKTVSWNQGGKQKTCISLNTSPCTFFQNSFRMVMSLELGGQLLEKCKGAPEEEGKFSMGRGAVKNCGVWGTSKPAQFPRSPLHAIPHFHGLFTAYIAKLWGPGTGLGQHGAECGVQALCRGGGAV